MTPFRRLPIVTICGLLLGTACTSDISLPTPLQRSPAPTSQHTTAARPVGETLDEMLLRIGDQSPGFGGIYWDSGGVLQIVHTRATALPEALAAIRDVMGDDVPALRARSFRLRPARFSFRELSEFRGRIEGATDHAGFVMSDVDEMNNRVMFGVETEAVRQRVMRSATQVGTPPEALFVRVMARPQPAAQLYQRGTTLAGGLILDFQIGIGPCTLTLPVSYWDSQQDLVTAGHCTPAKGSVDPSYFASQGIQGVDEARELYDPAYLALAGCPAGDLCRYSDAAIFRWANNPVYGTQSFGLGLIATPAWDNYGWGNDGPLNYTDFSTIIGEAPDSWLVPASPGGPLMGLPISKIGYSTGFTTGEVKESCITFYGGRDLLCQYAGDVYAQAGDSGSPLINRDLFPRVYMVGLVHSVDNPDQLSFFSSITGIQRDFGPLQTYPAKPHP